MLDSGVVAGIGVGIVAVYAVELDGFIVEICNIAPNLDSLKAYLKRYHFTAAGDEQRIKLGLFAAPKDGVSNTLGQAAAVADNFAVRGDELIINRNIAVGCDISRESG